jgi:tetratricopeptide (TPR) repeat protein
MLLGLIGLNAWWYWRGTRPVPELQAIERWVEQGRLDEAQQALGERQAHSPHDGDSHALLAQVFARRHNPLASARELHQVPFWWPDKGKWLLMEAAAFRQADRLRDAEAAWQAIVRDDPLHPMDQAYITAAVRELQELFAIEGRRGDAARLIWSIYDRTDDPHQREALLIQRLRTEIKQMDPATAAGTLERCLAADPEDWEARRALGKVRAALNHPDEARRQLELCIRARPDDPRGWADELALLTGRGDLDALARAVAQIPASVAEDPGILAYRARLLERDGRWPEAVELYRRVVQARPWERDAYDRLASLEERLGQAGPAREHRRRSESLKAARRELEDAFHRVLDLRRTERGDSPSDASQLHAAFRRLARICQTLGWTRDAEGWASLAPPER